MDDSGSVQCCGRTMTRIALERRTAEVELHSCASCGQHAWRRDGHPVGRDQLLETLQAHRPAPTTTRPRPRPATAARVQDARRTDLQGLLSAFTVHGSTS